MDITFRAPPKKNWTKSGSNLENNCIPRAVLIPPNSKVQNVVLKPFSLCCFFCPVNLKPLFGGVTLDGACFPHEVVRLSKDFFFDAPQILQLCCEREVAAEAPSIGGKLDETIALRL